MKELLYQDITYDIRGACFWVYKEFGGAFKEKIVDRALSIELKKRGRKVEDQKRICIYYEGEIVGTYIPDKIIDEKVLVEIKCKSFISKQDEEQFWKYLKGSDYKLGLLINFSPEGLNIKRIAYDTARDKTLNTKRSAINPRLRSAFRSADKGFTLIEMLMYVSIMIIIIVMIASFLPQLTRTNSYIQTRGKVLNGARGAMEIMAQEIKHSSSIYTPTSVFGSSHGQLSLMTARNPIANEDYTFVDFYVDDERLYVKKEEVAAQLIISEKIKITNINFTHLNTSSAYQAVRISLTASYDSASSEIQKQSEVALTSTVSLRSY